GLGPTQFHDDGTAVAIGEEHRAALAAAGSAAPDGPAAGRLRRPGACRRANDGLRIIPGERAPTRAPRRGLLEEKTRWHSATTRAAARRTDRHALRARRLGQHRPPSCNEDNRKQGQSAHLDIRNLYVVAGARAIRSPAHGVEPASLGRRQGWRASAAYLKGLALIASPFLPHEGGLVMPRLNMFPPL